MNETTQAIVDLVSAGNWSGLIALGTFLAIAFAKRYQKHDKLPQRLRWLRPVVLASAAAFGTALVNGTPIRDAWMTALYAAVGAMGLHSLVKGAKKEKTDEE